MSQLIPLALFGWVAAATILFAVLPTRRAIVAAFLVPWLFLPIGEVDVPFVHINKPTATAIGALLGLILFGRKGPRVRLHWVDVPMILWCVAPLITSLLNQLGAYDGASATATRLLIWGTPYFLGRKYFADLAFQRELAFGIFVAGLVYVPLCLFEIRMSPQLHQLVYGEHQHSFLQTLRTFGLYRPMVFMDHGLMVGLFMSAASLVGLHLWRHSGVRRLWGFPMGGLVAALVATTLLCQSFGALVLLLFGLVALAGRGGRRRVLIATLVVLPVAYLVVRVPDLWTGAALSDLVANVDTTRAHSLRFRFEQEAVLREHALERPIFGWGGFGRAFPTDLHRSDHVISDSLWIVVLGQNGLFGLVSLMLALLLPIVAWSRRCSPKLWSHPTAAPGGALAVVLAIYVLDSMVNMMVNPVYMLAAGSLAAFVQHGTLALRPRRSSVRPALVVEPSPERVPESLPPPGPSGFPRHA